MDDNILKLNFLDMPELNSYILRLKYQGYTTSIPFSLKDKNGKLLCNRLEGFLNFITIKSNLKQEELENFMCQVFIEEIFIEEVLLKEIKSKMVYYISRFISKINGEQVMDDFMKKLENNHFDITEPQMGVEFNPTPETVEQHQQNYQKLLESGIVPSYEEENVIIKKRTLNN